jgi:hypothetical protein
MSVRFLDTHKSYFKKSFTSCKEVVALKKCKKNMIS